jgi:hypothetical protein
MFIAHAFNDKEGVGDAGLLNPSSTRKYCPVLVVLGADPTAK